MPPELCSYKEQNASLRVCDLFNDVVSQTMHREIIGRLMNNEIERMLKEAVEA
jgi:hypothetical protein